MKTHLIYLSIIFSILGSIPILRQVNNPLRYELIASDEIYAMRQNFRQAQNNSIHWYHRCRQTPGCIK
jgi:hypothetical protein